MFFSSALNILQDLNFFKRLYFLNALLAFLFLSFLISAFATHEFHQWVLISKRGLSIHPIPAILPILLPPQLNTTQFQVLCSDEIWDESLNTSQIYFPFNFRVLYHMFPWYNLKLPSFLSAYYFFITFFSLQNFANSYLKESLNCISGQQNFEIDRIFSFEINIVGDLYTYGY